MKIKEKKKAIELRKQGISICEIAKDINVSKSSVSLWVRDIKLSDKQNILLLSRKISGIKNKKIWEERRKNYQKKGRKKVSYDDWEYAFGCALYWAEGAKSRNTIDFTNSDSLMMKFFVNFLRKYFDVNNEKISLRIQCHINNGLSVEEIQRYWLDLLNLPEECLRKMIIPKDKKDNYRKNIHVYGTCKIRINSTEIVQQIFGSVKEYIKDNSEKWLS